jgi:fluoride ion exporter CrcB/FEX
MEERERLFWVLGFLGSFTTFSSFMLQSVESWAFSPALTATVKSIDLAAYMD